MKLLINLFFIALAGIGFVVMRKLFNKRVKILFTNHLPSVHEFADNQSSRFSGAVIIILNFMRYLAVSLLLLALPLIFYTIIYVGIVLSFRHHYQLGIALLGLMTLVYALLGVSIPLIMVHPGLLTLLYYPGISSVKDFSDISENRP